MLKLLLCGSTSGLRPIHPDYLLAVSLDSNSSHISTFFDEVGRIDYGISIIFLPLLHIFTIFDSILHRCHFPLVLTFSKLLKFVFL